MTTPTKLWLALALAIITLGAAWCAGYRYADARWTQRDTDRQLADATAAKQQSEQYRLKEQKLNETIGEIETRAINDAANSEVEYKDVMDRLRNASDHAANGLRVKPALACRALSNNSATTSDGNEEVKAGLSAEIAGRIIGVGAECDQVVLSLDACQAYAESLQK